MKYSVKSCARIDKTLKKNKKIYIYIYITSEVHRQNFKTKALFLNAILEITLIYILQEKVITLATNPHL
jgi:hypothetical protein